MNWLARFFKKKILLKYDNNQIEELFVSSFVEQINDFQVHFSSFTLFLYSILNIISCSLDETMSNRIAKIILFSIQTGISIIVVVVGRKLVFSRYILLYVQQIYFIAIHTILILDASQKSDKLYLILVSFCLHILIMPQSQHIYILLSNIIYYSLIVFSYTSFNLDEMWQIWVLFGIIGIEIRLCIDETQKRILFHEVSYMAGQIDEQYYQINGLEQASPTSSTRYNQQKQAGINLNQEQQYRQLQTFRNSNNVQHVFSQNGNNLQPHQVQNQAESLGQIQLIPIVNSSPTSNQQKSIMPQNSKGAVFSSQNILNSNNQNNNDNQNSIKQSLANSNILNQANTISRKDMIRQKNEHLRSSFTEKKSSTVSHLKRKMTIFQMKKGMEDLRKLIYSSSMMMVNNNEGSGGCGPTKQNSGRVETNNGMSNSNRQDLPYSLQVSPLGLHQFDNTLNNPYIRKQKSTINIYNYLPFSFIYGKLDPNHTESIHFLFSNERARNLYHITDSIKLDDFLKKCKISTALLKTPLQQSSNSFKKMIVMRYLEIVQEKKNSVFQINSNPHLLASPDFKRNGHSHLTVGENQLGMYNKSQYQQQNQQQQQSKMNPQNQKLSLNQNRSQTKQLIETKDNETEIIETLIDIQGQKWVAKVVILYNDEFFIIINDDSFEKFILDSKKKAACIQLINYIDMMSNRFQSVSSMLVGNSTKKEVLYETFLATNYALNMRNSLKEALQCKLDIQQKKFQMSEILVKVKEMVERESNKDVQILINENIPQECKKIYNDYYHLLRTLTNIIENAYNNTKQGFVQILIHQSKIFKENVRFDIIDSGRGIDPQIVKLINENNFFNDEEEEDAINRLFLMFTSLKNDNISQEKSEINGGKEEEKNSFQSKIKEDAIIKGFGLKFSHHMIKILGPYNRIYAESIPDVGSRISFIIYKEGIPSQEGFFKPYQFKNDNFEQEMAYFNPLNSNPSNNQNCTLKDYIEHVLNKLEPPPFISNSLININKPCKTKKFQSPFKILKTFQEDQITRIKRSTSAHQFIQYKNIVPNKIRSQKNIIDQHLSRNSLKQLSPLIQGTGTGTSPNYKFINQNSLALSLSPSINAMKTLNPSLNFEGQTESISHYFRTAQPSQSQMCANELERLHQQNLINNGIPQITNAKNYAISNITSPKNTNNQNLMPGVILNYSNYRRNNSNPNTNNNTVTFQDSNLPSAIHFNNNSNNYSINNNNNSITHNIINHISAQNNVRFQNQDGRPINIIQSQYQHKKPNKFNIPPYSQQQQEKSYMYVEPYSDPASMNQSLVSEMYPFSQEQTKINILGVQKIN